MAKKSRKSDVANSENANNDTTATTNIEEIVHMEVDITGGEETSTTTTVKKLKKKKKAADANANDTVTATATGTVSTVTATGDEDDAAGAKSRPTYETRLKAISPIAHPLASTKLSKKVYRTIRKGIHLFARSRY